MIHHAVLTTAGAEFETPERCAILEMFNVPEDRDASLARARLRPGVTTQLHSLVGVDERYIVLEGEGEVEIGGRPFERVRPGSVVLVPRGETQRARNTGSADLVFLCLCTPAFSPECYRTLE